MLQSDVVILSHAILEDGAGAFSKELGQGNQASRLATRWVFVITEIASRDQVLL